MKKNGIVVAGALILDKHYSVDCYPGEGMLASIGGLSSNVGGSGNLLIDLAKLDPSLPLFASAIIGTGEDGRTVRSQLARHPSIDCSFIREKGITPFTLVIDAEDTKQRTFFTYSGASADYDEASIDWDHLPGSFFQLEYLLLLPALERRDEEYGFRASRLLAMARKHGFLTSFDVVSRLAPWTREFVKSACNVSDYCSINEIEAGGATGLDLVGRNGLVDDGKAREALFRLREYGISTWAVIHSAHVGYGIDCRSGICYRIPSLRLPPSFIKGTTGAGDAYCAGILYGAHQGLSLPDSMKLASASAACSLSRVGGTEGMREYKAVMELYEKYAVEVENETF